MPVAESIIVARDLRKSYGTVRAVDGISFEVAPGEVFGIHDGAGLDVIGTDIIGLAVWAVIAFVIAIRLFKWE